MARSRKLTKTRKARRGGGYGFGGSVLGNSGGSNAGNAMWNSDTGKDCGAMSDRGGNNTLGGRRRHRKAKTTARRRHSRRVRGGTLALQQPRAGYTFDGSGEKGLANAVPVAPNTTNV
jgi:hypothetical protein